MTNGRGTTPGWAILLVAVAFWTALGPAVGSAAADSPTGEATPEATPEGSPSPKPKPPVRGYLVPNVGFDTDDGLGFGARFELQHKPDGYTPYKFGLVVHGYATLRGYHHHRLYFDFPGIGPKGGLRLTLKIAYRQWLNDGYWGIGNGAAREGAYIGDFDKDDPRRKRYRYNLIQPFLHLGLRQRIKGPWSAFVNLRVQYTDVRTYEGSLLAAEQPVGMGGGLEVELGGGLLLDTRDNEAAPNRGTYSEIAVRVSPDLVGVGVAYVAPFLSLRGYHTLVPGDLGRRWTGRIVFAHRLMAEWLLGNPPFYEMTRWGGSVPLLGFGGYETLRGAPFGRYRAPGRAILNAELRFDVLQFKLFKQPFRVQIAPFIDVGAVFGAGEQRSAPAPAVPIHPSPGVGLHVVYAESFAGRIDFAVSPDPVRQADGRVVDEPWWGLYLMFDQCF